jgi:hypothetical protein
MSTAKYTSKCHECGLTIRPGDAIEPGYRSFRHADCTWASVERQVAEQIAAGRSQAEIWVWLNNAEHLTDQQKLDAIFLTR